MTCRAELLSSRLQMPTCLRERASERREREREREGEREREREGERERESERERERERERKLLTSLALASVGNAFILENAKQAAKALSDQNPGDGSFN